MRSVVAGVLLVTGCTSGAAELPAPDYGDFRAVVYPLLLRDCGFSQCHGDPERFFVVWGPGRLRLEPDIDGPFDPPTEDEVWLSYQRTRSALTYEGELDDAPLLQKPLEGHAHRGEDVWGRNLWQRSEPSWQEVARWAAGVPLAETEELGL
ncbi:hypothetical protein ENSA5_63090 [Enhygromyxa salina]|uniref:Uncharacterized protein n=1 Tax=Enhygromyxa salina TaxID=215803 RepID=A0A2S9XCQ4_9BACT|nr:hypothetical protein [Enhygromyxa salina]PRP90638.1 hypothetical protein ENSA5_63090 [Enhygromyxa salina]